MATIPVLTQLRAARPVIESMVKLRSNGKFKTTELSLIHEMTVEQLTNAIHVEYEPPDIISSVPGGASEEQASMVRGLYAACCTQRLHIDFSQCIENNSQFVWMPTQRDTRFHQEISRLAAQTKDKALALIELHSENIESQILDRIREDCVRMYMQNSTHIYLYVTRNTKASETLDKKFDKMCNDVRLHHGIHVQLFNLSSLMFNVTDHIYVPKHERMCHHLQQKTIHDVMKQYNMSSPDEFACISHLDPVARFIGLQPDDVCKITRRNKTSGDFIFYRRCVHESMQ